MDDDFSDRPNREPRSDSSARRKGARRRSEDAAEPEAPDLGELVSEEDIERFSALQLCDFISQKLAAQGMRSSDLRRLRDRVAEMEEMQDQARSAIEELGEAVDKLKSPALRIGTLLHRIDDERAMVCVNGTDYVCSVDPSLPQAALETGMRMLLNEAFAITDSFGVDKSGAVAKVAETLPDGRLRVGNEHGLADALVVRSSLLAKEKLKPDVEVRLDPNNRVAVEIVGQAKRKSRSLETVESVRWSDIGGQEEAIEAIRDAVELPYLHPELFERFQHPVPKGFLLYGPPGCGKTLLGKATAFNLRQQVRAAIGEDRREYFLHVKGPEILNMWLGESERQVRDLFAQCREKAAEGRLAFIFIDEAESILGTRGLYRSGSNIQSTLVPMFCSEMDGMEALQNVVVILASNRADLIDPAILRPGRIDRKIRVKRPNKEAAQDIYRIYLKEGLPLAEPCETMIDRIVESHYAGVEENRFLEVTFRSGRREFLHRGDLASGAVIAGVVERAKGMAIKRSIAQGEPSPIGMEDLSLALEKEYQENELFPPSDVTEDWLKLTDFDPENVARLRPYRRDRTGSHIESI